MCKGKKHLRYNLVQMAAESHVLHRIQIEDGQMPWVWHKQTRGELKSRY